MSVQFARLLLKWNQKNNKREMPWKGEPNPYYVWLSEIILQQTRVEQGLPYYLRFKEKFPTVGHLAKAKQDEVMKLWEGLGYYSRARNLHETAKHIHLQLAGNFPNTFDELKKLKGVGDYTAAAIASFVFGEQRAVVDGNVIRVLSRVFGVQTPFDTGEGKKEFAKLAQHLLDKNNPGLYNQAIMDFGAVVCLPQNPKCEICPFAKLCLAKRENRIDELPRRSKKTLIKNRYFNYLLLKDDVKILLQRRTGTDIWKNLYELPLIETPSAISRNRQRLFSEFLGTNNFAVSGKPYSITQMLSHQKIHFTFHTISIRSSVLPKLLNTKLVRLKDLPKYPFPRTILLFLNENSLI